MLAIVLALAGALLIVITAGESGSVEVLLRELGAVFVTTGILVGIYEPLLRQQVVRDVFHATDLSTDLADVGLDGIRINDPEWEQYIAGKRKIVVVLHTPLAWDIAGLW